MIEDDIFGSPSPAPKLRTQPLAKPSEPPTPKPRVLSPRAEALKALPRRNDLDSARAPTPAPIAETSEAGSERNKIASPERATLLREEQRLPQSAPKPKESAPKDLGRWTVMERRVYVALTTPQWRGLKDAELARRCKLSRAQFSRLRNSASIVAALREHTLGELRASSQRFVDHVLTNIALPGRAGSQDRRLYAQLTGLESPKQSRVDVKVGVSFGVGSKLAAALDRARAAERRTQPVDISDSAIDITPST